MHLQLATTAWCTAPQPHLHTFGRHCRPAVAMKASLSNEQLKESLWVKLSRFVEDPAPQPGTLILLRHGRSESPSNTFTGWSDPDLSEEGEAQALEAARAITAAGYSFDVVYTSMLKRAVRTSWLLLLSLERIHLPVWKTWRLNERCYGALTGESFSTMQELYGQDTVASWRRSADARPPPFSMTSKHNPVDDPRYQRWHDRRGNLRPVALPNGESMAETMGRCLPAWKSEILPELRRGKSVLVVAHGNTIRAIVQAIDDISDEDLGTLEIPPGIPLVYRFERTPGSPTPNLTLHRTAPPYRLALADATALDHARVLARAWSLRWRPLPHHRPCPPSPSPTIALAHCRSSPHRHRERRPRWAFKGRWRLVCEETAAAAAARARRSRTGRARGLGRRPVRRVPRRAAGGRCCTRGGPFRVAAPLRHRPPPRLCGRGACQGGW